MSMSMMSKISLKIDFRNTNTTLYYCGENYDDVISKLEKTTKKLF